MTPEEFVLCFRREKDSLVDLYMDPNSGSEVSSKISSIGDRDNQRELLNAILTDAFYHVLLSLDGCAAMGGCQQVYLIEDENGEVICDGSGSIEALAYHHFHESKEV